jgi:hypothetical protein
MWPFSFARTQKAVAELVSAAVTLGALLAGLAIQGWSPVAAAFSLGQPAAHCLENLGAVFSLWLCRPTVQMRSAPVLLCGIDHSAGNWVVPAQRVSALVPPPSGRSRRAAANPEYSSINSARRSRGALQSTSELE